VLNRFGAGSFATIIDGIDWVAESWTNPEREPIEVINMSLGGTGADDGNCGFTNNDPLHQAICTVVDLGVTVVVAAGNESRDAANAVPAAYDEVITVSAIDDEYDTFASFSNFGADVDVTAPGVDILSAALQPRLFGQYSALSGTSFSSPHVAGASALFIRSYIDAHGSPPTPDQVKQGLLDGAEPAPLLGWPGDPDEIDEPLVDAENL
jgi:subtilisin family serine protease